MKSIAYFQFAPVLGKIEQNRQRIVQGLADIQADLVVLPELAFTGYCFENRDTAIKLAENLQNSASLDLLHNISQKNQLHIVSGFAEMSGEKVYNSAVLVGPKGLIAVYRKIHLFGFESELFDSGSDAPTVHNIGGLNVGMMICYDWFFPETARMLAIAGADVIAHPANLVLDWCQKAMVTRCLENNLFSVTANRCGLESHQGKNIRFTGRSQIAAPKGKVLASAVADGEDLCVVEINVEDARNKHINMQNHLLKDRRVGLYGSLIQ